MKCKRCGIELIGSILDVIDHEFKCSTPKVELEDINLTFKKQFKKLSKDKLIEKIKKLRLTL